MKSFMEKMKTKKAYLKDGNGTFIHSCHTHCEGGDSNLWNQFAVNGVTMQEAVAKWWNGDEGSKAAGNNYSPCYYNEMGTPRECNSTCGKVKSLSHMKKNLLKIAVFE